MAVNIWEGRVIQKIATATEWANSTILPYKGEFMIVSDSTGKPINIKVGNGTDMFPELPYMFDSIQQNANFVAVTSSVLPTPTANSVFSIVGEGTYTKAGQADVVVPSGNLGILVWDGTVWSLGDSVPLPQQDISDIELITSELLVTDPLNTYTTSTSTVLTTGNFTKLPFNCTLDEISFNVVLAGTVNFRVIRLRDGTTDMYDVVNSFVYVATTVGVKTLTKDDIGVIYANKDDILTIVRGTNYGTIGYKAKTGAQIIQATGNITTSGTFSISSGNEFGINIKVSSNVINKKLDSQGAEIKEIQNEIGSGETIGLKDLSSYNTSITGTSTRAIYAPFTKDGYISKLNIYAFAGNVKFKIFSKNEDDTYKLDSEFTVVIDSNGIKELEAGIDFPLTRVKKDGLLGFVIGAGGMVGYKTSTGTSYWNFGLGDISGDSLTPTVTTTVDFGIYYSLEYGIKYDLQYIESQNNDSEISVDYKSISRSNLKQIGIINKASLTGTSLPDGWAQVGGWTYTANGVKSPATGSWTTYVAWSKLWAIDEDNYSVRVVLNDINSIFAITRLSSQLQSTAFEVDGPAEMLRLYNTFNLGATPTVGYSKEIGFTLVSGREYQLSIKKSSENYVFTFTDLVTLTSVVIPWNATGNPVNVGKAINYPGVIFREGDILVKDSIYASPLPTEPRVIVIGDSIVDGDTIRLETGGGADHRWAGLVSSALNYNATIIARGGETSTQINTKLPIINQVISGGRFAIYEVGINDTVFATWQANMIAFRDAMADKGIETVLVTLFPRTGREAFCTEVTNYVMQSGMRYIDFARAMTIGGDRVTRNNSYFLSDNLHPNVNGHKRMFEQVKVDLPELF